MYSCIEAAEAEINASVTRTSACSYLHTQPSLGLTENGPKKRKYPVSGSCVDENALSMSEVRGE